MAQCHTEEKAHPSWLLGPPVYRIDKASDFNENSRECFSTLMDVKDELLPTKVQFWVDVRDAAKSHILALDVSKIPEGRYLVTDPAKFDSKKVRRPCPLYRYHAKTIPVGLCGDARVFSGRAVPRHRRRLFRRVKASS